MKLDELEEPENQPEVKSAEWVGEGSDETFDDLTEAIALIRLSKTVLDYVSNPDLTKTLSKRERTTMWRLSERCKSYLEDTASQYEVEL